MILADAGAYLQENMLVSSSHQKPLLLFHLLYTLGVKNALCFTKSVESAARLVLLLEQFDTELSNIRSLEKDSTMQTRVTSANYTSELSPSARKEVIREFCTGKVQVLVCSDLIARGMDFDSVGHVINYDVPVDMRKYVHRVGRTARAGREGVAWTLVESQEAKFFKGLLSSAGRSDRVKRVRVKREELRQFEQLYEVR